MKKLVLLQFYKDSQAIATKKESYQGITGSIIFSMWEIRTKIVFTPLIAAQFAKNPGHQYTKAVKIILQYLKGLKERKIMFVGQDKLLVKRYSDFY